VTLKVKFADFQQITRGRTVGGVIEAETDLATIAGALLEQLFPVAKPERQMSLTI
jgi:DNA polymerase-4